jgi:N-acetylmuramoyl-L-alanine amidase
LGDRVKPKRTAVSDAWDKALKARADFESQPEGTHTKASYTKVMDGFRAIYRANAQGDHAAEAVAAEAELLAEQGRELGQPLSLRLAVGQYEYLRQVYPASPLRTEALLAEGRIEDKDLGDRELARVKYRGVVKEAPKSEAADEARAALKLLNGVLPSTETAAVPVKVSAAAPIVVKAGKGTQVLGIRHWSTATYTRVAIDLGDAVTFEAARVPNPDRIYFDLHGARLAEQVGKSVNVTDDGFLTRIRAAQQAPDVTRVVLDVTGVKEYSAFLLQNPYRLIIDVHGDSAAAALPRAAVEEIVERSDLPAMPVTNGVMVAEVPAPRTMPVVAAKTVPVVESPKVTAVDVAAVSAAPGKVLATSSPTSKPVSEMVAGEDSGIPVTGRRRGVKSVEVSDAMPAKAADRTASGETSLVRALGLKIHRIVIDAGHGGKDSGTLGVGGIEEKDVVLDVALRLGKMLHDRLGAEVIYTRSDDTFIPLETRTAIANKAQADLFLSIHANSSADASARGVETYYLNFTTDQNALDVAARENAVSEQSVHQLSDLVKKIALKNKIAESQEFAADVEGTLYAGLQRGNKRLKNRGVKKAPFVVLIGANMPSILAEISFVTNPKDAAQLAKPEYRSRIAESLFAGVAKYEQGLAGGGSGGGSRARPAAAEVRASMQ